MSNKKDRYFIALNGTSQNTSESVIYYNANASLDAIYECATARIQAVINLLENLYELKAEENAVCAIASVSALLLNDATTMLEALDPIAVMLRDEK